MFVELGSECPGIDEMVSSETPLCTSAEAVSYTHLDVYKRQEKMQCSIESATHNPV